MCFQLHLQRLSKAPQAKLFEQAATVSAAATVVKQCQYKGVYASVSSRFLGTSVKHASLFGKNINTSTAA
jgi:hypothetical protein